MTAIIFGATGAVGSALVQRLVDRGGRVLLAGRSVERLQTLGERLDAPTARVEAGDSASIRRAFEHAAELFGNVDAIANCMGNLLLKPAHSTTDEEWDEVLAVNLSSSFHIVREAGRAMRRSGGSIVLASSAAARIGMPNHEAIAAAKAGIQGLARSAAATYAGRGIRVNVVAPGLVRSEMTRSIWENEAQAQASLGMHALGRLGEADDVAACVAWLLDSESDWITGQIIGVDGGLSRVLPRRRG
jgi:NAD(P)-dependent dehydrogenase (short-subunit alcohol dehydrogenase family)